VSGEKASS